MAKDDIVRLIDDLGRVVIPKEFRRKFGIKEGSPICVYYEGDRIILEKFDETKDYSENIIYKQLNIDDVDVEINRYERRIKRLAIIIQTYEEERVDVDESIEWCEKKIMSIKARLFDLNNRKHELNKEKIDNDIKSTQ